MKKLSYLDFTKGICMILIVFGHCFPYSKSTLMVYINTFHVPAYYIISGMLMEHTKEHLRPISRLIKANILRLLVPYICFETLCNIIYCAFHGFENIGWLQWQSITLYGAGLPTWFLPVLFASKAYIICVRKLTTNNHILGISCLIPFCIALFSGFSESSGQWQLYIVFRAFNAIGFVWVGIFLYRHIEKIFSSKAALPALLVVSPLTALINGLTNTYSMRYQNPALYVVAAIAGTLLLFCIGNRIHCPKAITFFSVNSVIILGTHQTMLYAFAWGFGDSFIKTNWLPLFFFIIAAEIPIVFLINRFAPFMIGKWYKR